MDNKKQQRTRFASLLSMLKNTALDMMRTMISCKVYGVFMIIYKTMFSFWRPVSNLRQKQKVESFEEMS